MVDLRANSRPLYPVEEMTAVEHNPDSRITPPSPDLMARLRERFPFACPTVGGTPRASSQSWGEAYLMEVSQRQGQEMVINFLQSLVDQRNAETN